MTSARAAPRWGRGGPLWYGAIGMALGLLVAVLVVPNHQRTSIVAVDRATRDSEAPGERVQGVEEAGRAVPVAGPGAEVAPPAPRPGQAAATPEGGVDPAPASSGPAGGEPAGPPIRIGVGVPSLGVLAALGPNYDIGDPRAHMAALLAAWKANGFVPVNGHDVQFVYRSYSIVSADEQKAACTGWATDDRVFAVFALQYFFADACPAVEYRLPFVTANDYQETLMRRGAPYVFTLSSTTDRLYRNWAHWAAANGFVKGRRIGLYHGAANTAAPALKRELVKLGANIVEEVSTDNDATGSPQDTIAMQRFRAARVDVAWLAVSSINQTNFMQQAQSQGYRPTYVGSDGFSLTADTATQTFPPEQFDGTRAMSVTRLGELRAGMPPTDPARFCVDAYAAASGRRVTYDQRPAEWFLMQQNCDVAAVVLEGLRQAGPNPTRDAFVAGLERLRAKTLGVYSDVTFLPGKHHGTDNQRTLRWSGACTCWQATGAFAPLWVP